MNPRCPDFEVLLAAADGRLDPDRAAAWQAHFDRCPECRGQLEDVRALGAALAELARAERHTAQAPAWANLAARLERPGVLDRLPLGIAAGLRQAGSLVQPAAAGGVAAVLAGLALGTWLALGFYPAPSTSLAAAPYEVSSLLADDAGGLAESYFVLPDEAISEGLSPEGSGNGSPAADAGPGAADSGGAAP